MKLLLDYRRYKPLLLLGIMVCMALFFISFTSATIVSTDVAYNSVGTSSDSQGVEFQMNANHLLNKVILNSTVTATRVQLLNSLKVNIANGTVVSGNATFNYNLIAGQNYTLVADSSGASYTYVQRNGPVFPNVKTELNWTRGLAGDGNFYNYSWNIEAIELDEVAPGQSITLISPTNNSILTTLGTNFTANFNITGINPNNYTWKNATFKVWKSGVQFNFTSVTLSGNNTQYTQFIDDFTLGSYEWNVLGWYGNDTFANYTSYTSNYSFNVGATLANLTYTSEVYETSSQTFSGSLSLLDGTELFDAKLVYNGTEYDGTLSEIGNNNYSISATIDIPTVTIQTNYSFYFKLIYSIGAGQFLYENTTISEQTVKNISLVDCSSATNRTLNFTAQNEENLTSLDIWNFLGTFEYWIGSGNLRKNVSINNLNVNYSSLCLNPSDIIYKSDAIIQYEKEGFVKRNYYLYNASLTNSTQNITLYLLEASAATAFIISVKDGSQLTITDAYIYVQRYYPGTGLFQTVAMSKTDGNGNTVAHFESETEDYRIIVMKDGVVVYTSPIQKVYCSATPCTIPIQTESAGVQGWTRVGNLSNLIYYGPTLNAETNIISYTYIDTSGTTSYGRLWVYYINSATGKQTICDSTSVSNAATLTCNVTGIEGTVYAEGYISRSPEILVWATSFVVNTIKGIMGFEGLFWAFIIILVLSIAGVIFAGIAGGIIGVIIGMIGSAWIGIAQFGAVTIWGIIILGVFIIWKIKN